MGKSTLINTIFASHLLNSKGRVLPDEPVRSTTDIEAVSHIIEENGVRLRLNIVDTPGYGDLVNNDRCWAPIIQYIKYQYAVYIQKELMAERERYIQDTRIHCCLFFIQPSGHALKPIDIVVLKKLCEVVNVVPVIAKCDSLTLEERQAFKDRIKQEFAFHNLRMYPYDNEEYDSEEVALNTQIKVSKIPIRSFYASTCFLIFVEAHHSLRSRRLGKIHHHQRPTGAWTTKSLGGHQRGRRKSLRVCIPAQLPHTHAFARPYRHDQSDPLRELQMQGGYRAQGEDDERHGWWEQADQPRRRPRIEQRQSEDDHERLLGLIGCACRSRIFALSSCSSEKTAGIDIICQVSWLHFTEHAFDRITVVALVLMSDT